MKTSPEPEHNDEAWIRELYHLAGLKEGSPVGEVYERMNALSEAAAPSARRSAKTLIIIQGVSVVAPLLWVLRRPLGFAPILPATMTLASAIILIAALWRMRWRGMQRTWARARLVAEVARGQIATARCPWTPAIRILEAVPAIRSLLTKPDQSCAQVWPDWRDAWVAARVDDQLAFYRSGKEKAERQRRNLSRWVTLMMDGMVALAVAGFIVALSGRGPEWLHLLGNYRLEYIAGVAGVLLPLGIILIQSLRSVQELNRRTASYARQEHMLTRARARVLAASEKEAMEIVESTETQLLGEVVDWYFEAETSEQFFQVRERKDSVEPRLDVPSQRLFPVIRGVAIGSLVFTVIGRIVLGRLPWVVMASAGTLVWLSYNSPDSPAARSRLGFGALLLDENGKPWQVQPESKDRGCIIIAHGLHDGFKLHEPSGEVHWMRELAVTIQKCLGAPAPNIGLVDWSSAAKPTELYDIHPGSEPLKFVGDIAAIRGEAREIGDTLAFRIAQYIREGKIDRRHSLHLIGHSAGGFLVARAALVLHELGLAPNEMHVTILDTPEPDEEILQKLPGICSVDYYVTSDFVRGLDERSPPKGIHFCRIKPSADISLLEAHSYAYRWYTSTVPNAIANGEGFARSPLVSRIRSGKAP